MEAAFSSTCFTRVGPFGLKYLNNLNMCKIVNNLNMCKKFGGKIGKMGFPICNAFTCHSHMSLSQV